MEANRELNLKFRKKNRKKCVNKSPAFWISMMSSHSNGVSVCLYVISIEKFRHYTTTATFMAKCIRVSYSFSIKLNWKWAKKCHRRTERIKIKHRTEWHTKYANWAGDTIGQIVQYVYVKKHNQQRQIYCMYFINSQLCVFVWTGTSTVVRSNDIRPECLMVIQPNKRNTWNQTLKYIINVTLLGLLCLLHINITYS